MQIILMSTVTEITPGQLFKDRVKAIVHLLPDNYREIVYQHYPHYKTPSGAQKLSNVKTMRSADVAVTVILEKIARGELKLKTETK